MENLKKINKKSFVLALMVITFASCDQVLDVNPKGVLTEDMISSPETVDGLVIAAYAHMPEGTMYQSFNSWLENWRADDAYKGGSGLGDQSPWYQMEVFSLLNASVGNNDGKWYYAYQGISRVHAALNALNALSESEYPMKRERIAEMHFLRGWIYFKLKRRYRWVPYFQEDATPDDIIQISNRPDGLSDVELWQKIADDFKRAADNLPPTQTEKGRANKYAAEAFLAHTLLFMAYELDDNHQLTNINTNRLNEALQYINSIKASGLFQLTPDFAHNWLMEYDNNRPESIWELQFSYNDGTLLGSLNWGSHLIAPTWPPQFRCCDFQKPTFNLLNAFRTDNNGLPLFDTFNDDVINNTADYLASNTWDPRIGHTIAIPGLPWKYQTELHYDSTGSRQPQVYGNLHSLKDNVRTDNPSVNPSYGVSNAKNVIEARYAEVLLWEAEILIELGRHMEALPIINQIRQRAAESTDHLQFADGTSTLNYNIGLYQDGVNITWTQENARRALQWERRLELAMEGRRFFDLVRWGIADQVLNNYFATESQRPNRQWLGVGQFTAGTHEFLPIPQNQINWSKGVYKQNPGYN